MNISKTTIIGIVIIAIAILSITLIAIHFASIMNNNAMQFSHVDEPVSALQAITNN